MSKAYPLTYVHNGLTHMDTGSLWDIIKLHWLADHWFKLPGDNVKQTDHLRYQDWMRINWGGLIKFRITEVR